jgi:hypothetical protein
MIKIEIPCGNGDVSYFQTAAWGTYATETCFCRRIIYYNIFHSRRETL